MNVPPPYDLNEEQLRLLQVIRAYGVSGPFHHVITMPEWAGRWHGNHFHTTQAATDYLSGADAIARARREGQT